jgi:hypothetical protein
LTFAVAAVNRDALPSEIVDDRRSARGALGEPHEHVLDARERDTDVVPGDDARLRRLDDRRPFGDLLGLQAMITC